MNNTPFHVVTGTDVDLIAPFPAKEAGRVYGWVKSFGSILEFDGQLKGRKAFRDFLVEQLIPNAVTFGVIDKNSKAVPEVKIPLVGFMTLMPSTRWNIYFDMATNVRALTSGVNDEALTLMMNATREIYPQALRVSCWVLPSNTDMIRFLKRNGFVREGRSESMLTQYGRSEALIHMGRVLPQVT